MLPGMEAVWDRGVAMVKSAFVIAAALVAAGFIALPIMSQVQASAPVFGAKGDRVDARPIGSSCSTREWPYFETSCLRDAKQPFGQARQVRLVSTDRLPQ
jgi:hypothetical protein